MDIIKILLSAEIDPASIKDIKTDIDKISNSTKTKPIKIKVDIEGKSNEQFKDMNLELQKLGKFDLSKTSLIKGMDIVGYSIKDSTSGITKFTQSLNDGKNNIVTYSGAIDKTSGNYEILGKSIRQASRENNTFVKELGIAIQRTITWSIAVGGFYKAIREIQGGVNFIKDVDKDLTSIQMVTGKTAEETRGLADEYANLGKQLGITTNEILKGSLEWYRQGKTASETNQLITASIMEAKLAGIDTATATEYLTSTLNGFKLEASDAIDVVSKMVAIDNIAATSVAELSEALKRSATSAEQAGVSLDTLLGYIGTVSSVSRKSASSVGESFKTMFARFQDVKQGNLDEDGLGLNDVENSLNRVGIALRSSETDFRDLDDVIADIADRWSSFDEVTQSSIAKSVAGVRQRENFLILMTNYQQALNLETESLNSAGLAQERYAIYLESTEAKMAKLTATGEKFWLNTLDSGTINTAIELLTALISGIDQLTNYNAILGISLVALSVAFALVYHNLKLSKISLAEYIALSYADITATGLLTVAKTKLAGALALVKQGFMLLFTTPLGWIALAIGGVLTLTNYLRKQREEVDKLTTTYSDYKNALETMNIDGQRQSLNEITEMQKELNKLFEDANKPLSNSPNGDALGQTRKNELADYIEQLQLLGYEVDVTTGKIKDLDTIQNNLKIEEQIKAITTLTDRQIRQNENLTALIDKYNELSAVENKSEEQQKSLNGIVEELSKKYDDLVVSLDNEGNMQITNIGILNDKKTALLAEKEALISNIKEKITALVNEQIVTFNNTKMTISAIRDRINAYNAEIEVINKRNKAAAGALSDSRTLELEDAAFKKNRRQNISGAIDLIETVVDPKIDALVSKYGGNASSYIPSGNSKSSSSSSSSSSKDQYKAESDRYALINQELERNNNLLAKNKTLQELAGDDLAKKLPLMEEEIELNKQRQQSLNDLNNERRKEMIELEKTLSGQGFNFAGTGDNRMITNLDAIQGKTKEVEESFNRYMEIQSDLLPQASQEWWNLKNTIEGIVVEQNKLIEQQKELERTKWIEQQNDLYDEQQERLQALESIQEKIVEIIRKRGEEEKKALDEAYNKDMEQLDERHNKRKEKYAEDLDLFKKNIQAKLDELDKQKEQEDYLDQLNKEREEANRLQSEIDVLSLDDSLTARNQTIELRKQLAAQNEKIAKLQQDKERDLLKQSLEDQLKNYEQDAKDKEDIADTSYENEKRRLEEDYDINKQFLDKKYSDEKVYAEARKSIMRGTVETSKGMFEDIYDAFEDFEDKFGKGMGILGDIIKKDFLDKLDLAQKAIKELDYKTENQKPKYDSDYQPTDKESGSNSGGNDNGIQMSKSDFEKYVNYKWIYDNAKKDGNTAAMNSVKSNAQAIRDKYGINGDKYSYDDLKNKSHKDVRFKNGGKLTQTGTGLINIDGTQTTPEWIFNDAQLKNIVRDVTLSAIKIATPKIPNVAMAGGSGGSNQYSILFDVKGNLDKSLMPDIQRMITSTIEKVEFQNVKNQNKLGSFRKIK